MKELKKPGVPTGILFLDEINCVSETLMPAMLQLLQSKQFGTHRLPEGWVIAAAGNPPAYNESARTFDTVTMDRVRLLQIEADYHVWRDYAHEKGLHPAVLSYLELNPEHFFCVERHAHGRSFVTARGWEDLSQMLASYERLGFEIQDTLFGEFLQHEEIAVCFAAFFPALCGLPGSARPCENSCRGRRQPLRRSCGLWALTRVLRRRNFCCTPSRRSWQAIGRKRR